MTIRGFAYDRLYTVLDDLQLDRIHEAVLEVLSRSGIRVQGDHARKILAEAGCQVDDQTQMVKYPPYIVETALKSCYPSFTFPGRTKEQDCQFSTTSVLYGCGLGMEVLDHRTGERRHAVSADVPELLGFIGALENVDIIFPPITFLSDKPMFMNYERTLAEVLKYAPKPYTVGGPFGQVDYKWHMMIAEAAGLQLIGGGSVGAPFTIDDNICNGIVPYAEKGWPVLVTGGSQMGASGPPTFAGVLVQQTAEALAGIVLAKLTNPACPVIMGTFTMPMDMRIAAVAGGGPELSLLMTATAQIARYYNMPSWVFAPLTDSKLLDEQAGYEKGMQWLAASIAGVSSIPGAGQIENEELMSYEQLVIDNEIIGMVKHFMRGIVFNEETLALEAIHAVGPIPGHYLKTAITKEWWQKEQYLPRINDRSPYNVWKQHGSKDVITRAKERVAEIVATLTPEPVLPEDVCREMDEILAEAEKYEMAKA